MSWKLKRHTRLVDLRRFSEERRNRFVFRSNKASLPEKLSCKCFKGASALGIVIFIFYVLIMIMFPVHLAIQENHVYRALNNKVKVATEMACYTLIRHLNAEGMSQGALQENSDQTAIFINAVMNAVDDEIEIVDLAVQLESRAPFQVIRVSFAYPYKTQFILKTLITKMVMVQLTYELPVDI